MYVWMDGWMEDAEGNPLAQETGFFMTFFQHGLSSCHSSVKGISSCQQSAPPEPATLALLAIAWPVSLAGRSCLFMIEVVLYSLHVPLHTGYFGLSYKILIHFCVLLYDKKGKCSRDMNTFARHCTNMKGSHEWWFLSSRQEGERVFTGLQ
ncbi:hypothetical protein GOODEAATRI_008343 [Goodea atripinnis]|uniref:Uncharacterized protein n=1 Tax=Goodea atripinnis TaxID=208336 RepID=A0ABV0NW77_9TELE